MTSSKISRNWVFLGNELRAELRHLQGLAAQTMFVVVASYLLYAGLVLLGHTDVSSQVVHVIFWLVMIFTIVNSTSSSFFRDASGRDLYYYSLLHPLVYFTGKLLSSLVTTLFHSLPSQKWRPALHLVSRCVVVILRAPTKHVAKSKHLHTAFL